MKFIKNIKLLMVVGLLLQVGIGFACDNDWAEQGQKILEALEFFASKSDSKLIEAAEKGNLEDLKSALNDPKVNINDIGEKSGMTALMYASRNGHKDMVVFLLANGADPNVAQSTTSSTALSKASSQGHKDIVKLLLDNGADPHIRNVHGATALQIAKLKGHKEIVQLIDKAIKEN